MTESPRRRLSCIAMAVVRLGLAAVAASGLLACSPAGDEGSAPAGATVDATAKPSVRPEIVLVVSIDTLRPDHLGLYGYERFTSPVLDAVASEGTVFEDASSTAPWTLPSHASLLTGLEPKRHRVTTMGTRLADEIPTLASMMAQAGYQTAAVVNSIWLGNTNFKLTRDFEKYLFVNTPEDRVTPNTWITEQAITWMRERGDRPLFVFMHYYDVHADYVSLPEYERLFVTPYEGKAEGTGFFLFSANLDPDYLAFCHDHFDPNRCTIGSPKGPRQIDKSVQPIHLDDADIRHLGEIYDAGIRQIDSEFGRIVSFLRQNKLDDRTLLVVLSDHGEEFYEHGRVYHFVTQYQEMLRIPLILRGPGVPAGRRIPTPVSILDIAPTLLSMVGAGEPSGLDGLDLSPLLKGQEDRRFRDRLLFGEAPGGVVLDKVVTAGASPVYHSVRRDRYKLVHESKRNSYALYDLESDPSEKADVSAAHPQVVAELRAVLDERRQIGAAEPAPGNQVELSPEERERLRALGYIN